MNCLTENKTTSMMFMVHVVGCRMPPVAGCALTPPALSDNRVHSLKKIAHLLLRKLFGVFAWIIG